ncbi:hypothetical protein NQ317_001018, partial [Molorchus minor]
LPPSDQTPPNEPATKETPPKNACSKFFSGCKEKFTCHCCKKDDELQKQKEETEEKTGCFSCLKKKGTNRETQLIVSPPGREKIVGRREPTVYMVSDWNNQQHLGVPRGCCKNFFINDVLFQLVQEKGLHKESISRKASVLSKKKSLTPTTAPPPEDTAPKIDMSLVEHTSLMKAAIPVLPICLALVSFSNELHCSRYSTSLLRENFDDCEQCLVACSVCVWEKPRFSQKDGPKQRIGSFLINTIIGFGQFFTVLFCLVGWGWSIWWGVIMVKVASKYDNIDCLFYKT